MTSAIFSVCLSIVALLLSAAVGFANRQLRHKCIDLGSENAQLRIDLEAARLALPATGMTTFEYRIEDLSQMRWIGEWLEANPAARSDEWFFDKWEAEIRGYLGHGKISTTDKKTAMHWKLTFGGAA
ncbi:hypothetical protein [Sphingomonas sp. G-3-2-10]|uniref:hypothetical protein n=1 Tax=Sphingomonas sp. G-3-2-10 TaxID=2728838 RepID=UPI00146EF29B|nr:hypothetical protein [Sphingomonas sp. G-3-2-10]NML04252.1 hypothetical protein [Sphingomonas sp. G-3-2-10]